MRRRAVVLGVVALTIAALTSSCRQPGSGPEPGAAANVTSPTSPPSLNPAPPIDAAALLHPARKFFGIALAGTPQSLEPLATVTSQLHKEPNLLAFFQDWTHPFNAADVQRTCDMGVVPELTWESWSWSNEVAGAPAPTQPSYAPRLIAAGSKDSYIRATAKTIASLHCTIMLRLDQEPNGRWYPWGVATPGMHNAAADYVAMWRHVWRIFHAQGATNVIWMWSPNLLYPSGVHRLSSLYPGNAYVDIVGIDGYLQAATDTTASVFGPILQRLRTIAPNKPWLVAETGAVAGPDQATKITALLRMVAANPRLIGLVYLDEPSSGVNWRFSDSPASLAAFRDGIANPVFGHGGVGS